MLKTIKIFNMKMIFLKSIPNLCLKMIYNFRENTISSFKSEKVWILSCSAPMLPIILRRTDIYVFFLKNFNDLIPRNSHSDLIFSIFNVLIQLIIIIRLFNDIKTRYFTHSFSMCIFQSSICFVSFIFY